MVMSSWSMSSGNRCSLKDSWVYSTYASSAEVRGLVVHHLDEVAGVKQQEVQEDKRDEEKRDEVNGEVEEITHRAHET